MFGARLASLGWRTFPVWAGTCVRWDQSWRRWQLFPRQASAWSRLSEIVHYGAATIDENLLRPGAMEIHLSLFRLLQRDD